MEAFWRAAEGIGEDRYFRGNLVGSVTRYSDRLLMFLLEALRPPKFGSGAEAQAAAAEARGPRGAEDATGPAGPAGSNAAISTDGISVGTTIFGLFESPLGRHYANNFTFRPIGGRQNLS